MTISPDFFHFLWT